MTAVKVNVSTTPYTIPTGKIAKVQINNINNWKSDASLYIGAAVFTNGLGYHDTLYSKYVTTESGTHGTEVVNGYIHCGAHKERLGINYALIPKEYILIGGEIIRTSNSSTYIGCTVFLEDLS